MLDDDDDEIGAFRGLLFAAGAFFGMLGLIIVAMTVL